MSQFGADHAALAGDGADATRAWDIGDAALAGDVAALQSSIEAGADINSANDRGAHPLMLAAHDASVECVSLLLKSGADVHRFRTIRTEVKVISHQSVSQFLRGPPALTTPQVQIAWKGVGEYVHLP